MLRKAHTMVDVILMTTVILVAAGLFVVPSFISRARYGDEKARTVCQSNLRQLALAVRLYADDYSGRLPIYDAVQDTTAYADDLKLTHWTRALIPYTQDTKYFQCPQEESRVGTDYYYSRPVSGADRSKFKLADGTVLFCEGVDIAPSIKAIATGPVTAGDPPAYTRHHGGSNYAFLDGSVRWLNSTAAPTGQPAPRFARTP